jgi:hypothetical protein
MSTSPFLRCVESRHHFCHCAAQLEAYGVQFGAHQNAVTGFESTCYELHVPTDNPELLRKAFYILRQLALEVSGLRCACAIFPHVFLYESPPHGAWYSVIDAAPRAFCGVVGEAVGRGPGRGAEDRD